MKTMICIVCPVGCHLSVDDSMVVHGNRCKRGEVYAIKELQYPTRMLTTTVRTTSREIPLLSVKTSDPIHKSKLFEVMKELKTFVANVPVACGDILIHNILDTEIDIVATRTIEK